WFRLEWAWRSAPWQLASHSNCGVQRRDRIVVHYCVWERYRADHAAPVVSGSANTPGAPAFRFHAYVGRDCGAFSIWILQRPESPACESSPRRGGAGKHSATRKIRASVQRSDFRAVCPVERDRAAIQSPTRIACLAGDLSARSGSRSEHREGGVRYGVRRVLKHGSAAWYP